MKMRKLRPYLAMSTIVANMLMITITLSLAALLVAWVGTTYGTFSGSSQLYFVQRGQALEERFVIENVWFNKLGGAHQIMIFVRNVGVSKVNIAAVYVNGTSYALSNVVAPCSVTSNRVTLAIGSTNPCNVAQFQISIPIWTSGFIFPIMVASDKGNQVSYAAAGP
jgi:hypothetical protein